MKICIDCKYFTVDNTEQPGIFDSAVAPSCRRYAPRILAGSGEGWSDQIFPRVREVDWCGEFETKEK